MVPEGQKFERGYAKDEGTQELPSFSAGTTADQPRRPHLQRLIPGLEPEQPQLEGAGPAALLQPLARG